MAYRTNRPIRRVPEIELKAEDRLRIKKKQNEAIIFFPMKEMIMSFLLIRMKFPI